MKPHRNPFTAVPDIRTVHYAYSVKMERRSEAAGIDRMFKWSPFWAMQPIEGVLQSWGLRDE